MTMRTNTQLMPSSRRQPVSRRSLREFQDLVNRVYGRLGVESGPALAASYPPVNIWGDSDHVYAEAELPGMQLDHLEIYITEGNQLTIQGERRQPDLGKGVWYGRERGFGQFSRTFVLPVTIDADKVVALFEHGVLSVTLPKSEAARPRRISVNDIVNSPAIKNEQLTVLAKREVTPGLYYTPRVDTVEAEEESLLLADLPGVKPEDVDVRFDSGELVINGRCPSRHEGANYMLSEYGVGDFYRAFSVSEHIDWQKISAEHKNGVLTVRLPKTETIKPKKIAVKGE